MPFEAGRAASQRVIRVWHSITDFSEDVVNDLLKEFQIAHPSIEVEVEMIPGGYTGIIERLRDTPADQRPDVLLGTTESVRLQVDSGGFVPVDACTEGETPPMLTDLLPVIDRTFRSGGRLWAAPFNISASVLFYDADRWSRAGVDPGSPPTTFEELEEIANQLVDSGETTTGIVLFERSASWLVEQVSAKYGEEIISPENGRSTAPVALVDLGGSRTEALLGRFQEMRRVGRLAWVGENTEEIGDLLQLVHATEPSGMTFHTSAAIGDILRLLETAGPLQSVSIGVGPLPGPPGGLAGGGAWWLVDNGDPAQVGAAWAFAEWMSAPRQVAQLASVTGYVPTTYTAADLPIMRDAWDADPVLRVGYDQLAASPDSPAGAGIQIGPMLEVRQVIEAAVTDIIDGGADPAVRLDEAGVTAMGLIQVYEQIATGS